MLKKFTNKKGFTLMEMLIVVAIIAILVAIAIPTFNNSLNKARVATDAANIRAAYAEVMVKYLDNVDADNPAQSETVTTTADNDTAMEIAGGKYTWTKGATVTISVASNGTVTVTGLTAA